MACATATVAGMPARVFRISFSGELAYEINVPGVHGRALWEALWRGRRAVGITPYGTETMHVLRAEKGYMIVGQDTDGTVTPHDLGMDWIVRKAKPDFIGKRSLARADTTRAAASSWSALLPDRAAAGGRADRASTRTPAGADDRHVTSSYHSAALGRTFALALVAGGRGAHRRDRVRAARRTASFRGDVAEPVLYDPEGARRDG